jgi:hypothetical protein
VKPLALIVLAACAGCQSIVLQCDIDAFVFDTVREQTYKRCGVLDLGADGGVSQAAMEEAQRCVLDAFGRKESFILIYDIALSPEHKRVAFTGVTGGAGGYTVQLWAYTGVPATSGGDTSPRVSRQTCNASTGTPAFPAIYVQPGCTVGPGRLCLECNRRTAGALLCGG